MNKELNQEEIDKVIKENDCKDCGDDCDCKQQKKELTTEVTSIAKEEEKTGKKINVPKPEELVAKASQSLFGCRRTIEQMMLKMSKRQIIRSVNAILDLPADGLPVKLKSKEEKLMYAIGQRAMSDRFIIIQHHINEEMKNAKKKNKQKPKKGEKNG